MEDFIFDLQEEMLLSLQYPVLELLEAMLPSFRAYEDWKISELASRLHFSQDCLFFIFILDFL